MMSWVSGHDRAARDLLSMVFYHLLDKSPKFQTINAEAPDEECSAEMT